MKATGIFLSVMTILLIFNWLYVSAYPTSTNIMLFGAVTGLVTISVVTSIVAGLQVLGSGFNGESIRILFGVTALIQILFSLNFEIEDIHVIIGLGLINNLFNAFSGGDFYGLGYFITTVFAILSLVSGILIIVGSD